jgi:hypothetical protein
MHAGREDAIGIDVVGRLKPGLSRKRPWQGSPSGRRDEPTA